MYYTLIKENIMKYSTTTISINPPFKIKQSGFLQQTDEILLVNDDLNARIVSFEEADLTIYLISCDNLGFPISVQNKIKEKCENILNKKCEVILACTHTHFAADPENLDYQEFCIDKIADACIQLRYIEGNLGYSYTFEPFDKVGFSRISNYSANIMLQILSIFDNNKRIINFIIYNCHPTVMNCDTPFFSAEYPGYILEQLSLSNPGEYFTFMQGADGDVSTRFTRQSQNYEGVKHLGDILINKIQNSLNKTPQLYPFTKFDYTSTYVPVTHSLLPINLDDIPANLTPRELETIELGAIVRNDILNHPEVLDKGVVVSCLKIGEIHLIFEPNELFSFYISAINLENSILICYSNGYSPYVTGFDDNFITYEKFTDTLTLESKHAIYDALHKLSTF